MRRSRVLVLVLCVIMAVLAITSAFAQSGTIRYTRWAGGAEARLFAALVQEFMRTHPNIQVKPEFLPWAAYWEKVRTTVMSGDAADVISLSNIEMGPYITRGAFMDLDNMSGATALYAQMLPGEQAADRVNGKIKAMPIGTGVRALVYNKALLDKAGIAYPSVDQPMTWDQFFEISRKLTIREGDRYTQYTARFHILEMYESLIVQYGGQLMDSPTRPTRMMIDSPAGIRGLALAQRFFTDKVMEPYTGEWQTEFGTPDSALATGKVAFMHTGPWNLSALADAKINFGTAPLPMANQRSNRGYFNSLAIFRGSRVAPAAWEFIKWVASVDGQMQFTKTGDLPANTAAVDRALREGGNPMLADLAVRKAFFNELPFMITGPTLPTTEISSLLETALTDLFQLRATPEQTAARIEAEGNAIIESMFE